MSGILRRLVPRPARRRLRQLAGLPGYLWKAVRHGLHDWLRFHRWSSASGRISRPGQLRAWIMGDAHKIEKALALPEPRPGFGLPVIRRLVENLRDHVGAEGWDHCANTAVDCLQAYHEFNRAHGLADEWTGGELAALRELQGEASDGERRGGCRLVRREEILAASKIDLEAFFRSRHSIRSFDPRPVDPALVERAVRMAQWTPTVCNRQSLRVRAYHEDPDRSRVLACQLGNRGFGHTAGAVLVVSCDLETFFSVGERNQCWIDGGLFSMSLVYALHSLGLGTCCLNWSVERASDQQLRRVAGIPDSEVVIMQVAVGHLPEELEVARSERKPLEEVLVRSPTR